MNKDNEVLIKKIKKNKVLQKEMFKYNSKQWEMYFLYSVSAMLMFIGYIFTLIDLKFIGFIMMALIIPINVYIIYIRNKITYIAECKVKQIFQQVDNWYYTPILDEIGERHNDIFKYEKFDNFGNKKIIGFEGVVFDKISKNPNKLIGKGRDNLMEAIKNRDEDAMKKSNLLLRNTSILEDENVIAFKTVSGFVFCAKENEL